MEAKSKEVTPHFVVEALTYEPECLPRLSTRYEVMGSSSVLDGELATAGQQNWMSSWSMELGHKWSVTFHYFGLSCDILRQDAKEYLLILCHM